MKECLGCNKSLNIGFFQGDKELCVLCDSNPEIVEKVKHNYEEVEDIGCVGGACTL